ncbi:MAG TPA: AI-2E family transporter [Flavobacteriales bacterium]|nr:AI-2E family transporter [Flavobacteriales bacterium]HMR26570.1 AI-2E family transporter [Flavobacteriales bacterium]
MRARIPLERFLFIVVVSAILVITYLLLYALRDVLLPFVVALGIAYLFRPLMHAIERFVRSRGLAALATTLLALAVIGGMVTLVAEILAAELSHLQALLSTHLHPGALMQDLERVETRLLGSVDPERVRAFLSPERLGEVGKSLMPGFMHGLAGVFGVLATLGTVLAVTLYTFFILLDLERILASVKSLFPTRAHGLMRDVVTDLARDLNLYFKGQFKVSLALALIYATGFKLIGLPVGIGIGLLAGLLNMVPYMALLSIVPATLSAALLAMETGSAFGAIMAQVGIVYAVAVVADNIVLTPRILGKATGLPPAIVLLALSIWGSLLGLIGMVLALPLTTVAIAYFKRFVLHGPEAVAQPPDIGQDRREGQ